MKSRRERVLTNIIFDGFMFGGAYKPLCIALVLHFFVFSPIFAEQENHDCWLPHTRGFDFKSLYFGLDTRINPPLIFGGNINMTGWGIGIGLEFGYDWDGWLFGVRYTSLLYNYGDMMYTFNHNMIKADVSKIFTRGLVKFLPNWLDLRLKVGIAYDFSKAKYFKNEVAKEAGIVSTEKFNVLLLSSGLFAEYNGLAFAVPFIGANFDLTKDKDGFFFMPTITVGIRTTVGKVSDTMQAAQFIKENGSVYKDYGGNQSLGEERHQETSFAISEDELLRQDFLVEEDDGIYKIASSNILFLPNSASFLNASSFQKKENERILRRIVRLLEKYPSYKMTIQGYANNVSGEQWEETGFVIPLSEERARAVLRFLVDNGIDESRLYALGMGSKSLVAGSDESWRNMRVEFVLYKDELER